MSGTRTGTAAANGASGAVWRWLCAPAVRIVRPVPPVGARVMPPKTRDIRFGKETLRIVENSSGFQGIVVGEARNVFAAEDEAGIIAKLTQHVLQKDRSFIGFDGARRRFLSLFPAGFSDPALIGTKDEGELFYKRETASWLAEHAPFADALAGRVDGETVLRAFQHTNLVDRHTKAKLSTVLRGASSGHLIEVLARFANGDLEWSCERISAKFADDGVATWPALTYLAFFWFPAEHAFLKPEFSQEYARRVGHRFALEYNSRPEPNTYLQFLDMLDETRRHVEDLAPADYIDLHSFMWVVSKYDNSDVS